MNRFTNTAALALTTALSSLALAGPLTPPAGPVAPTYKTLTEVEPRIAINATNTPSAIANQFVISQPGSYYLTADLTASPGTNPCIVVNASNVTLDLNGFSIRTSASDGVTIGGDRVTVRNGRIAVTGNAVTNASGVNILSGADEARIEGVTIAISGSQSACVRSQAAVSSVTLRDSILTGGTDGVRFGDANTGWTVTDVQCRGQSTSGIVLGDGSVVERCVVRGVGNGGGTVGAGIWVGQDSAVRECQVIDPRVAGSVGPSRGINVGSNSVVDGCTVTSRGATGVFCNGVEVTLRNNNVRMLNSGMAGMTSQGSAFIADNKLTAPGGVAIQLNASQGNTIIRNHISATTTPIAGTSLTNNIIGPVAGNGNPTANTNPHANFIN